MAKFRFQDLQIWEEAIKIADRLFDIADILEKRKLYRFAEQLRGAGMSKNGALGGKVMGTGGGGFMLFCVDNGKRKHLRKTLESAGLKYMDFKFDWEGVKTLVNI